MNPIKLLIGYGFVVTVLIAMFLRLRNRHRPSALKMGEFQPTVDPAKLSAPTRGPTLVRDLEEERSLNVYFNYNGHSWDAYEVLGVPAGCGRKMVEEAYDELLAQMDEESQKFIITAFSAIKQQRGW